MIYVVIILIIIIILLLMRNKTEKFENTFKAPPSLTTLKQLAPTGVLLNDYTDLFNKISTEKKTIKGVNILQVPTFFNCNEKWKGCLPRPLYQGTCGSCWGFASVVCLSSRFYIESCGNGGCTNYPQIDAGSFDDVVKNINNQYGFKKDYLETMAKAVDVDSNGNISKNEWIKSAKKLHTHLINNTYPLHYRHMIAQILVFMLDFQSLGSVDLSIEQQVIERAEKTFKLYGNPINLKKLQESWRKQPLNLSAEKLITCCTDCIGNDSYNYESNNPACGGGSLQDAWKLLRDTGTTTSLCIGYNLDNYTEGDKLTTCKELQGPYYSFCSGYKIKDYPDAIEELKDFGNNYPVAIPNDKDVPWTDPQLFRFRAKNAYQLPNNMYEIQKEIIERGPVTTGFVVYNDFQEYFGGVGLGGQKYTNGNPLGSSSNRLIYMKDPDTKEKPVGGHAVVIVGWGTFKYKNVLIPYWTLLNSWGAEWGHSGFPSYSNRNGKPKKGGGGYFWMVRGINNCGIEENVVCGQPNLENISYTGIIDKYGWGLPPPSNVTFLDKIDTNNRKTDGGIGLEILPATEAGGTFVDYVPDKKTWQIKSSKPPSPYLMFWPDERPLYTLHTFNKEINKNQKIIEVDDISIINQIRTRTKNPIFLLDGENKEQIQLIGVDKNKLTVLRGVNYSKPLTHKIGTKLKIFPYESLETDFLSSIIKIN